MRKLGNQITGSRNGALYALWDTSVLYTKQNANGIDSYAILYCIDTCTVYCVILTPREYRNDAEALVIYVSAKCY